VLQALVSLLVNPFITHAALRSGAPWSRLG
jgi:hypothetical protein